MVVWPNISNVRRYNDTTRQLLGSYFPCSNSNHPRHVYEEEICSCCNEQERGKHLDTCMKKKHAVDRKKNVETSWGDTMEQHKGEGG